MKKGWRHRESIMKVVPIPPLKHVYPPSHSLSTSLFLTHKRDVKIFGERKRKVGADRNAYRF